MTQRTDKYYAYSYVGLILFYIYAAYFNVSTILTDAGVIVPGTDAYYRLHRILEIVHHSWFYPLFDSKLNFPDGWNVAWPLGLDYVLAFVPKIMGVTKPQSVVAIASLLFPLLTIPLLILVIAVARYFENRWVALGAGLLFTLTPTVIFQIGVGQIDHHVFEAMFALWTLWLFLQIQKNNTLRPQIAFILVMGLSSSIYPHGWFPCILLNIVLVFTNDGELLKTLSNVYFFAFLVSLIPLSFSDRFLSGYVSIEGFSWWGSLVLMSSSFFASCIYAIRKKTITIWMMIQFPLIIILAAYFHHTDKNFLTHNVLSGWQWLFHRSHTLSSTVESHSLWQALTTHLPEAYVIYILPLILVWFVLRKKHRTLVLFSILPITLVFLQVRFLMLAYPFISILIVLFLWDGLKLLHRILNEQRYANQAVLTSVYAAIILIGFSFSPTFGFVKYSVHDDVFYSIRAAAWFMRDEVISEHLDETTSSVLAAWDYGHWILYHSNLPVVDSPFQEPSAQTVDDLFISENQNDFEEFQKARPIRFLLLEQSFPRFWTMLENGGKNPFNYFKIDQAFDPPLYQPTEKFDHVFYYRYLQKLGVEDSGEMSPVWRLVFVSPFNSQYSSGLPAVKVFEKVKGVEMKSMSKIPSLWLRISVEQKDGEQFTLRQKSVVFHGIHHWRVPYAQVSQGGVECNGIYEVIDEYGKSIGKSVVVTNDDVVNGNSIDL